MIYLILGEVQLDGLHHSYHKTASLPAAISLLEFQGSSH
jgi:hypothetical protein